MSKDASKVGRYDDSMLVVGFKDGEAVGRVVGSSVGLLDELIATLDKDGVIEGPVLALTAGLFDFCDG